jgi:hypothetical protein
MKRRVKWCVSLIFPEVTPEYFHFQPTGKNLLIWTQARGAGEFNLSVLSKHPDKNSMADNIDGY